jgi:uncharacterized protein with HEPN domain
MSEWSLVADCLENVLNALEKILKRFAHVQTVDDFVLNEAGMERLDSICMLLIAVGEAFKHIDRKTCGALLSRYPEIDWAGVKGVRDVIAHEYFDIDAEQIFNICRTDILALHDTVKKMIDEIAALSHSKEGLG